METPTYVVWGEGILAYWGVDFSELNRQNIFSSKKRHNKEELSTS